jgi:di/tricarboxylate transporter
MTFQIGLVLAILGIAVVLFVSEKLRVDVVALLVLVLLALTRLVSPQEALSGFSNPAVITVWAVFILSGGLSRTGIAGLVGRQVLRLAGSGEMRLIALIMLTSAFLSAFMNNVGVAALLLPVVMDIAHRTGRPPSKLLIPLAFSSLLGGLTTQIGTPPNLLISAAVEDAGLDPFDLFDFAPVGGAVVLAGIAYMTFIGRRMLPVYADRRGSAVDLKNLYSLEDRLFAVLVPEDSALIGKTLAQSRFGPALGLSVLAIQRAGESHLAPDPAIVFQAGDRLLVEGVVEKLVEMSGHGFLDFETSSLPIGQLLSSEIDVVEVTLLPDCPMAGQTLSEIDFRRRFGAIVLAVERGDQVRRTKLETMPLEVGDVLLVQGTPKQLDRLRGEEELIISKTSRTEEFALEERLMVLRVPESSPLAGLTLAESRLGFDFGLGVMGIVSGGTTRLMPAANERIEAGDTLFVKGDEADVKALSGLQNLKIGDPGEADLEGLESDRVAIAEVVLAPRAGIVGKSLVELHFREKYGLNVLAITREGQTLRENLRHLPLKFGDALLLHGPREKLKVLGSEPDFLVLTEEAQEPLRLERAPVAALIMGGVVLSVLAGWLPIYIAAICGALLMVLSGCLTMDDAYRAIEWRAVFLIAGMLPLGLAMQSTGAAELLTSQVVRVVGGLGPLWLVAALYMTTAIAAQVMPTSAVAILMAPIALSTANQLGLSPYALVMTISLSASASFMSPVAHPANVLIMGPGGYRFIDYIKVGLPLTIVCLITTLLVLPIFWPLQ